ncbi:MAG: nuclear transport factor 2 family protein [Campylobacterales bacterium]|nr:nuclear transport factor 2 family protein [Campylobacterales bacterium]
MNHVRVKTFFETLDEEVTLDDLKSIYAEQVHFKNPFYELDDIAALYRFFRQLYQDIDDPTLLITESVSEGEIIYLNWIFRFSFHENQERFSIDGVSRMCFDERGKIFEHTDYWDVGENIYETFPLLGTLIRWVKKRIRG